ncbi:hypothetical protein [Legionella brunensis]|uniref:Uncharacterized protein n=1 Tax=Legionella brunensis TaxID=29422 RepID=A0A0W0SNG7_9GAMM|nr:hypothetical protein [Legionella brunensis]KTC84951.1 hypothetical protein Lbru_1166 [Legionella brunensis]
MSKSFKKIINQLLELKVFRSNPSLSQIDLEYAGEEVLTQGKPSQQEPCQYLDEKERQNYLLVGKMDHNNDYKLYYKSNGKLADTSNFNGKMGLSYAAYAIDKFGRMYINEHISSHNKNDKNNFFFHSSFLSGQAGVCFGMCVIKNGKIEFIDNRSGHYKPTTQHLKNAIERLMPYFSPSAKVYCQQEAPKEDSSEEIFLGDFFHEESEDYSISEFLARF